MENVRGMISAELHGEKIFLKILNDLKCPKRALKNNDTTTEYEIFSFVTKNETDLLGNSRLVPNDYLICSEKYGVPQNRHRVILFGVRKDMLAKMNGSTLKQSTPPNLKNVIGDLPKLRSGLSEYDDNLENWIYAVTNNKKHLIRDINKHNMSEVSKCLSTSMFKISRSNLKRGEIFRPTKYTDFSKRLPRKLVNWYKDPSGWNGVCNHVTRSHMEKDLHRYMFCACYSKSSGGLTPKTRNFPKSLYAKHANWSSGIFADRFRVQSANKVATTVTSHIAKDGHYYIHYDPEQCRSLTVREAARIQTFPDNYFFVGNRTQQYVQVGNAVPPFLARQIADIVFTLIC